MPLDVTFVPELVKHSLLSCRKRLRFCISWCSVPLNSVFILV